MNAEKTVMSTGEAALALGISRDTVIRWCSEGKLDHDWDGHIRRVSVHAVMIAHANRHLQGATQ